jgi:hypothetical protein|tara:strand:- start:148 stop:378 length:231 start_codon:yes stop_codon:yes gene_type:complete
MIASDSFGKIDGFSVGDLVRWSRLEDKKTGIIRSLKLEYEGGRNVAYADIILLGTSKTEQICCLVLEKIAKSMTKN